MKKKILKIFLLIIILMMVVISVILIKKYLLKDEAKNQNYLSNTVTEDKIKDNQIDNETNNEDKDTFTENSSDIYSEFDTVLSCYKVKLDENDPYLETPTQEADITFINKNEFSAYLGFGFTIKGSYTKKNNIIECSANSVYSSYSSTEEKISASFSFKIKDDTTIEIIKSSNNFDMHVVDENLALTDEIKNISLNPFIEGYVFELHK